MTNFPTSTTTNPATKSLCVLASSVILAVGILAGVLAMSTRYSTSVNNTDAADGTIPTTIGDPKTCPFKDEFHFDTDITLQVPDSFDAETMCTDQDLESIASALQIAMDGPQLDPKLHLFDFRAGSGCDGAGRRLEELSLEAHWVLLYALRHHPNKCIFCVHDWKDANSRARQLRSNDNTMVPSTQRRTNVDDELCGCHKVNFADAITSATDCTNEYLLTNGISVLADNVANTANMDFVRPVSLGSITASDDTVIVVTHVNGETVTLGNTDPIPSIAVSSLTILDGAIDRMEYCYEACPRAKALFDEEIADIEAELNILLDTALEDAAVPCLQGIDVNATVTITTRPIDQPVEC